MLMSLLLVCLRGLQHLLPLLAYTGMGFAGVYSHSMVAGGLLETS
jgi:hypothetical protein